MILTPRLVSLSIKVRIPPEEEAIASKACGIHICIVSLFVYMSKATEKSIKRKIFSLMFVN